MDNNAPSWFEAAVLRLYALYPTAQLSKLTVPSWWSHLGTYDRDVLAKSLLDAPRRSAQFCPSAEIVREICEANAKGKKSIRKGDLNLPALPPASEPTISAQEKAEQMEAKEFFAKMRRQLGISDDAFDAGTGDHAKS